MYGRAGSWRCGRSVRPSVDGRCSGSLGGLAGNVARLGTPDRHTFPPDGKPRAPRPASIPNAVFVALSSRHRRSLTRARYSSPVRPVPRAFRMNGNAFRKEGHNQHTHTNIHNTHHRETMNQLLF
ncbi:hypothetical protein ACI65C_012351 [Semiaphis heraclei]